MTLNEILDFCVSNCKARKHFKRLQDQEGDRAAYRWLIRQPDTNVTMLRKLGEHLSIDYDKMKAKR